MDCITLTGLKFTACHGCLDFERFQSQPFIVDTQLYLNLQPAGQSDDLTKTVNYAAVYDTIKSIINGTPQNLIETLAEQVADQLLKDYPLKKITVTIHKPQAPLPGPFADVSVTITRSGQ